MSTHRPTTAETVDALVTVREALDTGHCYLLDRRFWFGLDGAWALVVSPDDAGRFRVSVAHFGRIRASMWSRAGDRDRLADLARAARAEAQALSAA